jgi:hypothetical protein
MAMNPQVSQRSMQNIRHTRIPTTIHSWVCTYCQTTHWPSEEGFHVQLDI